MSATTGTAMGTGTPPSPLHALAAAAGIEIGWRDVNGVEHKSSDDSLRAVLAALGIPAGSDSAIRASGETLRRETGATMPPLVTADLGRQIPLPGVPGPYRLVLETGEIIDGMAIHDEPRGVLLPAVHVPGYHRLEFGDAASTIAVAPPRAYTLADAGQGRKLWGLAVQLYALRRAGDGGIGDFAALADFVTRAAGRGADAVAISPVHAQFSSDVTRFGPYAPSNRAALNVLHVAEDTAVRDVGSSWIDWPGAAAAKLQNLRRAFEDFHDHEALQAFRRQAGLGLERHAIFEALTASLAEHNAQALDWRQWPAAYQDPDNAAVARFVQDNGREVSFHAYLQYRADQGLVAAQAAAKAAGMKIGLIADLAVGTDHAGSHSWSRQQEVLRGLELGAPPDLINREGQSWGITAFSPRGLRNSGFSAFIDMLRHALRHAGGVRIDHIMGLARLWVIPHGFGAQQGAYLRLPVDDLMRLVRAGIAAQPGGDPGRGPRHAAARLPGPAGRRRHLRPAGDVVRAARAAVHAAGQLDADGGGDDHDARSADRGRLVAGRGYRLACQAWHAGRRRRHPRRRPDGVVERLQAIRRHRPAAAAGRGRRRRLLRRLRPSRPRRLRPGAAADRGCALAAAATEPARHHRPAPELAPPPAGHRRGAVRTRGCGGAAAGAGRNQEAP